jgi:predicted aspartyl protease
MSAFLYPVTISGPYGQYTVEALVDRAASFTVVPATALIEMGIEPARVVRLRERDGSLRFGQLGRALTTVAGVEDIAPVLFGEPGTPTVLGKATLDILLLRADEASRQILSVDGVAAKGMLDT